MDKITTRFPFSALTLNDLAHTRFYYTNASTRPKLANQIIALENEISKTTKRIAEANFYQLETSYSKEAKFVVERIQKQTLLQE